MKLQVWRYELPFVSPFVFGSQTLHVREGLVLALCDGADTGWGDASPLAGFGEDSLAGATRELLALNAEQLVVPDDLAQLSATADALALLSPAARSAIATALLDLASRRAGASASRWLADGARASVTCNATVGGGDHRLRALGIRAAVRDGYRTVKLKTGGMPWCDELDLLEATATLYKGIRLRLDPNGQWSEADTAARLRTLRDLPIDYVEQPVAAGAPDALLRLARGEDGARVAGDESLLLDDHTLARLVATDGLLELVIKPAALGGPDRAVALVRSGTPAGATVTTMLESAVGRAMAAHVACAVDTRQQPRAHGLATGALLAADIATLADAPTLQLVGPGLGVEPEVSSLERLR